MSKKITMCPGGMPIQNGKEPTAKGSTFPGADGQTTYGATKTGERTHGNTDDICALRRISENSSGGGQWGVGCRRCQTCYLVKNVSRG